MIVAVLINLYGVVAKNPFDTVSGGRDLNEVELSSLKQAQRDYSLGSKNMDYLADTYSIKLSLSKEDVATRLKEPISVTPKINDILKALRNNGLKTCLISNIGSEMAESLNADQLRELFDKTYLSFEVGMAMPDPKFIKDIAKKLNISPKEILYIDSDKQNLAEFSNLGAGVIEFESEDTLLAKVVSEIVSRKDQA
jgi:FMN phosphatase YigB (HAD superfamily)